MQHDLLSDIFKKANAGDIFTPNDNTVVTGALSQDIVNQLADAGVQTVINFQPNDELTFDEASAVKSANIDYVYFPITGASDLTREHIQQFDAILQAHQDQSILMHCKSGNRVGAVVALQHGWLKGEPSDKAIDIGKAHGLSGLAPDVAQRLTTDA